jgi:malonate-semialdehyde dehydrogenase (acetylating)/methylmalonate-semialdehyde dehydrogenase
LDASEKAGVTFDLDGRAVSVAGYEEGNFIGPTILSGVKEDMSCYTEEIFGPVLCCMNVPTLDEAIALVNRNAMGNGAQFACFACFTGTTVKTEQY